MIDYKQTLIDKLLHSGYKLIHSNAYEKKINDEKIIITLHENDFVCFTYNIKGMWRKTSLYTEETISHIF